MENDKIRLAVSLCLGSQEYTVLFSSEDYIMKVYFFFKHGKIKYIILYSAKDKCLKKYEIVNYSFVLHRDFSITGETKLNYLVFLKDLNEIVQDVDEELLKIIEVSKKEYLKHDWEPEWIFNEGYRI